MNPINKEQEEAIKVGIDFIEKGNPNEWLIIGGKAGTGKTTIANMILKPYIKEKAVLVCALSHKAKLVISEKLAATYGSKLFISKSVAGALGMNMDVETGKFQLAGNIVEKPIKNAEIIIVDEGSMINEESHNLIMKQKRKKAKVIYLGDIRQLPPIREQKDENEGKPSPIFYGSNRAILKERIRQGEESPILPYADYYGDNSRLKHPNLYPVHDQARKNNVTDKGALVFADNTIDVIKSFLQLYKYAVEKASFNIVKTVVYRNNTRTSINKIIRQLLFGVEESNNQFVVGDLLMFQDNYSVPGMSEPISNSYEVQVNKVESIIDGKYKCWKIDFIYEGVLVSVFVLDESEVLKHREDVSKKFAYAKSLKFGSEERADALASAWGLKNKYAPIDYAYAITSHKSQGSTYNTVIVDERDIMSVSMISAKEKSQSMYTAITRASTTCVIICNEESTESLDDAFKLSLSKIVQNN